MLQPRLGCRSSYFFPVWICAFLLLIFAIDAGAQNQAGATPTQTPGVSSLRTTITQIISRPEFRHATFGIEFYSLDTRRTVFSLNANELFTPASTTKLFTEGTALALLGPDYRFHTRVYGTGSVKNGTLHGDLVLVASGDPNLSGRIQPDGTLAFENEDHSYDGSPHTRAVPGDPLLVIHQLANQVAAKGVRKISGRVLVDNSLFPEGEAELGTGTIISPICINDNIIDVTVAPGVSVGAPVSTRMSPWTRYVTFVNQATTAAAGSKPDIRWGGDVTNADGTHTVILAGSFPMGMQPILYAYAVPQPSRFAQMTFTEALQSAGIKLKEAKSSAAAPDFARIAAAYRPENLLAEHVSPALSEEVKVTLKVSQNLHASLTPYILGALVGHQSKDAAQAGFDLERGFLQKAGLDLSGASQADGAGGSQAAYFTPNFVVHYLAFVRRQDYFPVFFRALPVLGQDGTLWNIQTASAAAGHVFAKTGTDDAYDALNRDLMVTGKGLAGYLTTPAGEHLAFALYANRVAVPMVAESATRIVGQALGEIAAAGYLFGAPLRCALQPATSVAAGARGGTTAGRR